MKNITIIFTFMQVMIFKQTLDFYCNGALRKTTEIEDTSLSKDFTLDLAGVLQLQIETRSSAGGITILNTITK